MAFAPARKPYRIGRLFPHNAPINVNPVRGECGQGAGIWCLRLFPLSGFWSCEATPGVGTFDFDRQKPGINSEAVTKSLPRSFLKVTLSEKGMKFSFVLIAIIRYFKLSSLITDNVYFEKVFIFKFPSDCKTRLKSNSTMKVRGFFTGHWSDLFRHVEQML